MAYYAYTLTDEFKSSSVREGYTPAQRFFISYAQLWKISYTEEEMKNLTSQFVISSWGGHRHPPFAFTEQGVAMMSSLLKSKKAIQMNITIMRAFVMIRQWALTYQELSDKLAALEQQHNQKFNDIDQVLKYLLQKDHSNNQQANREQLGYKN